jgi:hypothetical protein
MKYIGLFCYRAGLAWLLVIDSDLPSLVLSSSFCQLFLRARGELDDPLKSLDLVFGVYDQTG